MNFDSFIDEPGTTPAIVARFEFLPERAEEFSDTGRSIVEMAFDSIEEVKGFSEEFKDALTEVTVLINNQVVVLSDYAGA